ncbi:glycosyltransferase family 2 protein [Hymenobacter sp. GOD-10R]|uniref:glycosyltransferase family 2 protein n=1 Tax=Hymenobacter sp. GOD-10R TaxID=3093922 RepID=UPI002D77DB4B|nr:glycosyltransferase family 2 protein [Hymenobacter sp. GOD-10R]WRQ27450.1 glycosyltransferase family 2 protein [Hymenobacter sp. GOD-10R]
MKLSIIIVNYNTYDMTCRCIESIYQQEFAYEYEIILVDNASQECPAKQFKDRFPAITLIENPINGGFAQGNNLAIVLARGEYILLLNSDTIVEENAIQQCVDYLSDPVLSKDTAAVGCKLCYENGVDQVSSFEYKIGLWSSLLDNTIVYQLVKLLGFAKYRNMEYVMQRHQTTHDVQALLGAYILCKREVIEKVGMLDPDFFMYYEEFEWCYRMRKAGYRLQYLANTKIIHIGGGTSANTTSLKGVGLNKQFALSKLLLIYKRFGAPGVYLYNCILTFNKVTNYFINLFRSEQKKNAHQTIIEGFIYAKRYQSVMVKYFRPEFSSAKFPFKTSLVEELYEKQKVS